MLSHQAGALKLQSDALDKLKELNFLSIKEWKSLDMHNIYSALQIRFYLLANIFLVFYIINSVVFNSV